MMTCDECEDQVLELIEREAREPDAVREILARCPDCRALFDETKATLERVATLPVEMPSPDVDAAILRAARARTAKVVPLRRRWFRSPQWAVAAVALLAVGIGVWGIPSHREEAAPSDDLAAAKPAPAEAVELEGVAQAPVYADEEQRSTAAVEEPEAKRVGARNSVARQQAERRPRSAKRKAGSEMDDVSVAMEAEAAPAAAGGRLDAAEPSADFAMAETMRGGAAAKKESVALSPECRRLRDDVARRLEAEPGASDADIPPEQALTLGRCHRAAGNVQEARRWLGRAAASPKTRKRARRELRELPPE